MELYLHANYTPSYVMLDIGEFLLSFNIRCSGYACYLYTLKFHIHNKVGYWTVSIRRESSHLLIRRLTSLRPTVC